MLDRIEVSLVLATIPKVIAYSAVFALTQEAHVLVS